MDIWRELLRKPRQADSFAIVFFVIAVLYTIYRGTPHTILVGLGFTLIVLGALPSQLALAFLVGASTILLVQTSRTTEGFASPEKGKKLVSKGLPADAVGSDVPTIAEDADAAEESAEQISEMDDQDIAIDDIDHSKEQYAEKFQGDDAAPIAPKKPMLPDNTDRMEPLELGKKYKLPNENDDKGFHLDTGTTFLNAYKALKPDQIAAMTKDTQELLATQKSLVSMLDSFGPLMKDMGKITGFLGPK